jgi:hypothetical protein
MISQSASYPIGLNGQPWHQMIIATHLYTVADIFEWAETNHAYSATCQYPYGGTTMACSAAARALADALVHSMTDKGLIPASKRGGSWYWKFNPYCEMAARWGVGDQPYDPIIDSRTGCFFQPGGNHVTFAEYLGGATKKYLRTFDQTLKSTYDEQFNVAFSFLGAPAGFTQNTLDSTANNFGTGGILGTGIANEGNRKYWGMFQGVGGVTGWAIARKLVSGEWPHVASSGTAKVSFRLADHTGATKVRISAADANGAAVDFSGTAYVQCATSPCSVAFPDRDMGGYMVAMQYLDNSNNVKATTGTRPVRVE